jgi:hypothetical protein
VEFCPKEKVDEEEGLLGRGIAGFEDCPKEKLAAGVGVLSVLELLLAGGKLNTLLVVELGAPPKGNDVDVGVLNTEVVVVEVLAGVFVPKLKTVGVDELGVVEEEAVLYPKLVVELLLLLPKLKLEAGVDDGVGLVVPKLNPIFPLFKVVFEVFPDGVDVLLFVF